MNIETQVLEERIAFEALDPVFHIVRRDALTNLLILLIMIAVMWPQIDHGVLVGWLGLMISGIGARSMLAGAYLRRDIPYADAKKWGRRLSATTLYFSVLWSSTIFLFYVDGSVEHQVFLLTLLIAISIGSVIAGLYWFPLFYLSAVPIMGAVVIRLAMQGTFAYIALAVLLLWALVATVSFARTLHQTMRSEMRLRHESGALAEALQVKTEEAQQATLAKSRFLAAASHDLRQPLHALSLFIDVLRESKSDHERAILFPRINLSLDALRKLFDALLDVSRLDAKVVKPEISHFDLAELLNTLAEEFASAASGKGLHLQVHARPSIIVSDRLLLERILRNLIGNAIRYTDSGKVLLSARTHGDMVLLQVWDTGIGIPQENQEEVFIEFQQLHNAHRDRTEGLGLGLALVRRLCRLLDHPLELRSQPGKGSVFSIRIPRGSANLLVQRETVTPTHSWDLSGHRVLVIDDERGILDAMQALLSKWGCEVVTAESLTDAIAALARRKITPDVILSDLRLRDASTGIDAIDSLRKQFGASIPGILITGDTAPERIKMAKHSGYELLQKPVLPAHLRRVIQHYLADAAK